ncbi:hypothetical protein IT087_03185 [Candidatus Uhrbacteria bacterium]|nr:hypothetical protein [Candidatus Uhrbacteria bacterium]
MAVDRYLDLEDMTATCDFIESVLPYLPEKDRKQYEVSITAARDGAENLSKETLAEMAKNIAIITWPQRRALARFIETVGSELEWEAVVKNVRPSTATVLRKLRKDANAPDLAATLAHPDASTVLKDDQEIEISMVRDEARVDLYEDHQEALEPLVTEASVELEAIKKRLKKIRERELEAGGSQQERLNEKLTDLEDMIYFGGEVIPLEVLDAEVQFTGGETVLEG